MCVYDRSKDRERERERSRREDRVEAQGKKTADNRIMEGGEGSGTGGEREGNRDACFVSERELNLARVKSKQGSASKKQMCVR